MKRKQAIIGWLLALVILLGAAAASACSAVYVGKGVSADGSVIIARTQDGGKMNMYRLKKVKRVEGVEGRMYNDDLALPSTTWAYTTLCYKDSDAGMWAMNEWGVTFCGPVTTYGVSRDESDKDGKIHYPSVSCYLAMTCKTASEAVHRLCELSGEMGIRQANSLLIADREEAWYIECYGKYLYCAVRLPEDACAVMGNMYMIDAVERGSDGVIAPDTLWTKAEEGGFAVYEEDGRLNVRKTWVETLPEDYSNLRAWYGQKMWAPSATGDYESGKYYPLLFKPDRKIGLGEVTKLFRSRNEGTVYDMDKGDYPDARPIAYAHSAGTVVLQAFDGLPADSCAMMWTTFSNPDFAPFLPVSSAMNAFPEAVSLGLDDTEYAESTQHVAIVRKTYALATLDRKKYGAGIREWAEKSDAARFEAFAAVLELARGADPELSAQLLSSFCYSELDRGARDCRAIYNNLVYYRTLETYDAVSDGVFNDYEVILPDETAPVGDEVYDGTLPGFGSFEFRLYHEMEGWDPDPTPME